jgi:large subunit ribosomal protein L30
MAAIHLKQVRSANRSSGRQRDTLRSLKLGRIGSSATHADTPQLQGMIRVIEHLVEVDGTGASQPGRSRGGSG